MTKPRTRARILDAALYLAKDAGHDQVVVGSTEKN
jgi:hypothetical protein